MHLVSVSHQPSSSMDPRNNPHGYYNQNPPHNNNNMNNMNMNTNGYGLQPQYNPVMHPPPQAGYGYPPQQPQWGGYAAPNGYDPAQQQQQQQMQQHMQHPQMQQQHHPEPVAPTPPQEIITPHENDVLMGRGGKNNQHPGNEQLRDMARTMRDRYKASAKKGKSNMSRELVQQVRDLNPKPGRFLKRNPITNDWEDVGDDIAREKVSQVLRDAVSEWVGPKAAAAAAAKDGDDDDEKPSDDTTPIKETTEVSSNKTEEAAPTPEASPAPVPAPQPLVVIEKPGSPGPRMVSTASIEMPEVLTSSDLSLPEPALLKDNDEDDFALAMAEADDFLTELDTSANEQSEAPAAEAKAKTPPSPAKSPMGGFQRAKTRKMSNVPVQAVPWARNKRKAGMFDRYASMNKGLSSSDMSIGSMGSQLSSRNLGTQLSRRQLMSTGARQMSSKQLSSRQLSSRQLSGRNLGRQASGRNMMPADRRQQAFAMMGESDLSLECLSISGMSGHTNKSRSRKNIFMQQYQDMDMGLSDFSLNSLAGPSSHPSPASGGAFNPRPSIIIEGDLEELSAHGSANFNLSDSVHKDLNPALTSSGAAPDEGAPSRKSMAEYADAGIGTSISNMTINTIGTFSGHSRLSRGLFSMGPSMRMDSMRSFLTNGDIQLDMLDDELFDEFAGGEYGEDNNDDLMDEVDDEFSSDFC